MIVRIEVTNTSPVRVNTGPNNPAARYYCTSKASYVEATPNGRWERVEDGFYVTKDTTRAMWARWV